MAFFWKIVTYLIVLFFFHFSTADINVSRLWSWLYLELLESGLMSLPYLGKLLRNISIDSAPLFLFSVKPIIQMHLIIFLTLFLYFSSFMILMLDLYIPHLLYYNILNLSTAIDTNNKLIYWLFTLYIIFHL